MQPEQIIPFVYENKKIRVTRDENGNPWFVAKDVCDVLGIIWMGNKTLSNIPDSWKGVGRFPTPSSGYDKRGGGVQELIIINEPALYKLSFRSNKAEADRFTNWVVFEVLPAIRKTGSYSLPGKEQSDALSDITVKLLADETESAFRLFSKKYAVMGKQGRVTINATYRFCFEDGSLELPDMTEPAGDKSGEYLTPTELGRQIGCSAKKINRLLLEKGLQTSFRNSKGELCYKPTEKGIPYAVIGDSGKKMCGTKRAKRLLWKKSVLGLIP